jgi:Ca-activated chloride channel family protein
MLGLQSSVAGLLIGAAVLSGQPAAQERVPLFRADTRLVVCYTTVRDKKQRPVHDLPQAAFAVYEDGVPQPIRAFAHEDVPVSLGLVIDNSLPMARKRPGVVAAALALVRASNPDDEVFVVNFNNEAYLDLPSHKAFTSDVREMEQALARLDARGDPLIRDAVSLSIRHLAGKARHDKKVLVVVTAGQDAGSLTSQEALLRLAHDSGVVIYAIGLLDGSECKPRTARRALEELAEATGGEAFFPKDPAAVNEICHGIARDIRGQYIIGFAPSNGKLDGVFRKITVAVTGPGRPVARTRSGYFISRGSVSQ